MSVAIQAERLRKVYPGSPPVAALKSASLEIADNEFFTLLGPSGCGKTTLLRLVAGFESITGGTLHLFGEDISHLPPEKRPVNTVFQHYSLFPHMTILDNVAFGLRRLGKSRQEAAGKAQEMLDLVQLRDYGARLPNQLSGGQQQRVALARALAPRPRVLLLDEPLSALDLKLRQSMRLELKRLQRETGITFVFVTHDQDEALAMSDRIAVMSAGEIQQIATPGEIYEYPANRFVAEFIGDANFYQATAEQIADDGATYLTPFGTRLAGPLVAGVGPGSSVTIFVRPEKVALARTATEGALPGRVRDVIYLGDTTDYRIALDQGGAITVRAENHKDGRPLANPGDDVFVELDPSALRVLKE
ncbi:ABC transporter ATP-binding protein [Pelagibius litoralis]|uniref:Spermidine/putrescine import ATP-binding protein PotA n=1 Tax=Pelagibius litoralis TaxID=374515 RepID=A0A967CB96_9PROT|nr:ABC transporter ATP-binding protein [Pelagibius litoralis]NIA68188.1 ABC transporter ATP-binding protein [Pelagibius litoralis]